MRSRAFTLAEVMITLTVIGIITAIILPVAFHSKPDENIMKFKKAHNTLYQVISTLINSDEYYLDGDLGVRADGKIVAGIELGNESHTYFCKAFSDVVSVKGHCGFNGNNNIAEYGFVIGLGAMGAGDHRTTLSNPVHQYDTVVTQVTAEKIAETKNLLDAACKNHTEEGEEIKTTDNIVYYEIGLTYAKFGSYCPGSAGGPQPALHCFRKTESLNRYRYQDQYGMNNAYKTFCVDIDGIPSTGSTNCDDKKDVCPFGYGIRADGKILTGARADEWLSKSIQGE